MCPFCPPPVRRTCRVALIHTYKTMLMTCPTLHCCWPLTQSRVLKIVRVVAGKIRSANLPHFQFCFRPIVFWKQPSRKTAWQPDGLHVAHRPPNLNEHIVQTCVSRLFSAVLESGLEKSLAQRSMATLSEHGRSTVLDMWMKHGLTE
jgi:hypothetical protein